MRLIVLVFFSALTVYSVNGDNRFENTRECPSGYFYAGEDTPGANLKSYWIVGKTPVYSCYRQIPVEGINDGLEKCYASVIESDKMEGRIVIFEDVNEVERVFRHILNADNTEYDSTFLTSAMYFEDVNGLPQWIYLGTNYTELNVNAIVRQMTDANIQREKGEQCLTVTGRRNFDANGTLSYEWNAVKCVNIVPIKVLCEIRIQTITYAWIPNWLTITLLILTLVLLVTCCIAAMNYKQHTRPRAYRGRDQSPQGIIYSTNDEPPKYSDVAGISNNTDQGKLDKYKNKGKEILAKIYVVKDK